ncbi:MAG: hypothetical protein HUU28_07230 [Planctomycetaceae bacterium]|nr:hypothetical protein [Planctomycetaceae bacterium]
MPPSHPITTTGLASTVTTTQGVGETVPKWIDRHNTAVAAGTPTGNTLTTTYTSANGTETVTTTRKDGESDAEFLTRHRADYLMRMVDAPPIP